MCSWGLPPYMFTEFQSQLMNRRSYLYSWQGGCYIPDHTVLLHFWQCTLTIQYLRSGSSHLQKSLELTGFVIRRYDGNFKGRCAHCGGGACRSDGGELVVPTQCQDQNHRQERNQDICEFGRPYFPKILADLLSPRMAKQMVSNVVLSRYSTLLASQIEHGKNPITC